MIRCWFVDDYRAEHDITLLCELVELPRATFYRWATGGPSDRSRGLEAAAFTARTRAKASVSW